jgi:hypothetical protein
VSQYKIQWPGRTCILDLCSSNQILTYLLTYSKEQSPYWEANQFAASQEILRILWNPKVHYRIHKWPPPVSIQSILPHPTSWRSSDPYVPKISSSDIYCEQVSFKFYRKPLQLKEWRNTPRKDHIKSSWLILGIRLHVVIKTLRIMFWAIQPGLWHNYISFWQHTNAFRRGIVYTFTNTVLTPRCMSGVKSTLSPNDTYTPKMWGKKNGEQVDL